MSEVFNILDNRIKELAVSRFEKPTYVQELAIPKVLEGKNVLVIAETGSGKTESVMLGLFNKLVQREHEPIALLYLTPMRALNRDLLDRLLWWCNKLDLDISVRHGDTTAYERKMQVENPPHILISTPEQINAMLVGKRLKEYLRNVKYVVIDECLTGDAKVTLSNGKKISIKKLVENNLTRKKLSEKPKNKIYVKSLGKNGKIVDSRLEMVHKISLNKKLFYLRTKFYNIELKGTEDHKILIKNGKKAVWRELKDVRIEDKILINTPNLNKAKRSDSRYIENRIILKEEEFVKTYLNSFGKLGGKAAKIRKTKLKSIVSDLKSKKLLPLKSNYYKTRILARLIGHIMGDGWITVTNKTKCVGFSADTEDLKNIERDLNVLGFKSKAKTKRLTKSVINTNGKSVYVNGTSSQMINGSRTLVSLFLSLGVPYGEKTDKDYNIPKWILESDNGIKREFLSSFIGSEFSKISGRKHLDFDAIRVSVYKREDKLASGLKLVKSMKSLLNDFGVKVSKIKVYDGNIRKNRTKSKKIVFTISNSEESLMNLIQNIGIHYNSEMLDSYKNISNYLICKKFARCNKINLKNKISKWRMSGKSYPQISRHLAFDKQLNSKGFQYGSRGGNIARIWQKSKGAILKGFPDFAKWIKNYYRNDVLIDEIASINDNVISEKYVYDLTIDETHNFLANDIVVHNCHELITSKRGVQLTLSLERLKRYCGNPQIIGLSATVGSPELAAKFIFSDNKYEIVKAISPKDMQINVESPYPTTEDKIIAEKIFIGDSVVARLRRIHDIIMEHKSALTFTNTREAAEILSSRLRLLDKDFPHEIHHSSLSKEVRIKAEKDFKEEKLKTLICTSSLELGIDIGSIDIVIQYMSPRQVTKITQKVGRSGHGVGRVSKGIIIAGEGDDIFESAVIARKALRGELEQIVIHENSLDVLTHQIMGMLIENYKMDPKEVYEIIKKAYPFRNLKEGEFLTLLNFLSTQLGLIYIDTEIKRKRRVFEYYFENLSVIPDHRNYKIIDTTTNMFVGNLDEEFIATHSDTGSTFIVRGRPWKILSIENDKIYVEGVDDITSAIPAWEGELIPVPFEVSQGVGELRKEIKNMIGKNLETNDMILKLKEKYPVSSQSAVKMIQLIKRQIEKHKLPAGDEIVCERFQDYVVLHSLFGNKVNETLSRFISTILSAEHGELITSKCDPYRMIFKGCTIEEIKKILTEYNPEDVQIILEKSLSRSSLFKSRFIHIAKRFGAISRSATFNTINIDRMIDAYWNSPIHTETLQELFTEKMDLEKTKEIIGKIKSKEIMISEEEGLSPLAELGFRYELQDVVKPERPEKEIFNLFKNRLMNSKVRLLCINCGKYSINEYVKDVEEEPRCRKCQSRLIAVLRIYQTEIQKIASKWLKGGQLTEEEEEKLRHIKKSADLVIVYGKKAVIAMAGRGVGPETAKRILAKMYKNEEGFYKEILKAERDWIKNKRFWQ